MNGPLDVSAISPALHVDFHEDIPVVIASADIKARTYLFSLPGIATDEITDDTLFGVHSVGLPSDPATVAWVSMKNWQHMAFWPDSLVHFNKFSSSIVDMDFQDSLSRNYAFRKHSVA